MIGNERVQPGFTLFEMVIAFGIFTFVMLSVMAVFIASLRIHRHSSTSQAIIDTVRFGLEFMEREMRTGRGFFDENGDGTIVRFCNDRGQIVRYRSGEELIERRGAGANCVDGSGEYEALTSISTGVAIGNLKFRFSGQDDADVKQPRITVTFQAKSRFDPVTVFYMQTTVSQRDLDIKK